MAKTWTRDASGRWHLIDADTESLVRMPSGRWARRSSGETSAKRGPGGAFGGWGDPPDITAPAVPGSLTVTPGDTQNVLDWADNSESDLAGYKVFRSTSAGTGYALVSTLGEVSAYTDTGLSNGTTYYYVVSAQDDAGNDSGYSSEASGAPVAPASCTAVTYSSAVDGDGVDEYFKWTRADVPKVLIEWDRTWSVGFRCRLGASDGGVVISNGYSYGSNNAMIWVVKTSSCYVRVNFKSSYMGSSSDTKVRAIGNKFSHVVVTHVASGETKIYIDGVLKSTSTFGSAHTSTNNPTIGCRWNASDESSVAYTWRGELGELAMWDSVLTAEQVTSAYSNGSVADLNAHAAASNLMCWLLMGDGSEDTTSTPATIQNLSAANSSANYSAVGVNWDSSADFTSTGPYGPPPEYDDDSTKRVAFSIGTGNKGTLPADHPALTYDWTRSFSCLVWFEIPNDPGTSVTRRLLGRAASVSGGTSYTEHYSHGFQVIRQSSSSPKMNIYAKVGHKYVSATGDEYNRFSVGDRICALLTFDYVDGGTHTLKLYINGAYQNQSTATSFNPGTSPAANIAANDFVVAGITNIQTTIYQIAWFDTDLTALDAFLLYNSGSPMDPTANACSWTKSGNVTAFHQMNEGSGTSLTDSVGSKNITLAGTATWEDDDA